MENMKCFVGVISKIIDPDLYTIEVEIPEENIELKAFPIRGEVDEPRVGDVVFLRELDPIYHSYYLYEKLKENDFIGIRSRGKLVKMDQNEITIGIFDPSDESWYDDNSGSDQTPKATSWIKIDSDGNIDINAESDQKINITGKSEVTIGGDCNITVSGNTKIESSGNCDIKAGGSCKIDSPDVKITGGQLTTNGTVAPASGPYNCLTNCIFSGCVHQGNVVSST